MIISVSSTAYFTTKSINKPLHNESIDVSELTPDENQSPLGVGITRDFIASTIETAVDAAEDLPHFWINTPPRFYRKRK